jgi:hypothetical protein
MQGHNNHNVGGKILAKGMEVQARSKHQQHYRGRRRASAKVKLLTLLVIVVAFFWWVYGWGEPV